jgi:hypothetical protein
MSPFYPGSVLKLVPSSLALCLRALGSSSESELLRQTAQEWATQRSPDSEAALIAFTGRMVRHTCFRCLSQSSVHDIREPMRGAKPFWDKAWQSFSQAPQELATVRAVAVQLEEVLADATYVPSLHVVALSDALGFFFHEVGLAYLCSDERHAMLAMRAHQKSIEWAKGALDSKLTVACQEAVGRLKDALATPTQTLDTPLRVA